MYQSWHQVITHSVKCSILLLSLLCCSALHAGKPQEVRTGIYLMNLYGINMEEHSYYADFYVWFKWKGSIDPTQIEFVNSIEKWSVEQATFDGDSLPVVLPDGTKYKIYRIESRFFHSFSLNRFPLDKHSLDIQIENPEYPIDSLVYLPDTAKSADVRNTLKIVGWEMTQSKLKTSVHDYKNNFGNPKENAQKFSSLTFELTLERPFSYFLLKMLLPIALVIMVSLGALLLHPSHIDTRSSLPIGGLLTAVFLQQTYNGALPDTGYMVLMDKIYLLGYIIISLILLQVIRSGNQALKGQSENSIMERERLLAGIFAVFFCLGVLALAI